MDFEGLLSDSQSLSGLDAGYSEPPKLDPTPCASGKAILQQSKSQPRRRGSPTSQQINGFYQGYETLSDDMLAKPMTTYEDLDLSCLDMSQIPSYFPLTTGSISPSSRTLSTTDAATTDGYLHGGNDIVLGLSSPGLPGSVTSDVTWPSSRDSEACPGSHTTCMAAALEMLQTLHVPSTACVSSNDAESTSSVSRQPRSMGSVLSGNRHIVQRVAEMLKCPCISSDHVQLVFAAILGKLIAWYRAMIRNFSNQNSETYSDSGRNVSTRRRSLGANMANERITPQPFVVGDYRFDAYLQNKIGAQVIYLELQQLETVVTTLSTRTEKADSNGKLPVSFGTARGKSQGMLATDSNTAHVRLSAFLHKQLQKAKAETLAISREG